MRAAGCYVEANISTGRCTEPIQASSLATAEGLDVREKDGEE